MRFATVKTIYQEISDLLNDKENQQSIETGFPKVEIPRRNTGYAPARTTFDAASHDPTLTYTP